MEKPKINIELIEETKKELALRRQNQDLFKNGKVNLKTPGFNAEELLQMVANAGATYEDIGSTPEELAFLFHPYLKNKFDKNK